MEYTLITGACGGLGKEFCRQLVGTDNLFLTGRSEEKLKALREELLAEKSDAEIICLKADLTREEERKAIFDYADRENIKFSGLINVAGADIQKEFSKYTPEKVTFQARLNFEAAVYLAHGVISRRAEKLKILTVSSLCGIMPMPYFALYSATKAALINFFTALRYEVKDAKITVLAPGGVPTRADVIEDIKKQGISGRLSSKPAAFVVKKALKGLRRNKRLVIPGLFNKFTNFIQKLVPTAVKCRVMSGRWKKKEKDAF